MTNDHIKLQIFIYVPGITYIYLYTNVGYVYTFIYLCNGNVIKIYIFV